MTQAWLTANARATVTADLALYRAQYRKACKDSLGATPRVSKNLFARCASARTCEWRRKPLRQDLLGPAPEKA